MKIFSPAWTQEVVEKSTKLEFLLLEVAILISGFIFVMPSHTAQAYETNEYASASVSWTRPVGHASFRDTGGKTAQCSTPNLSCSTPNYTYWPGSPVNYTVRHSNSSGPVIKTGNTTASTKGWARASWSWNYVIAAYPTNLYNDCFSAGADCKTAPYSSNSSNPAFTLGNLKVGQPYRVIVCTPTCGGGGAQVYATNVTTGVPARLNTPSFVCVPGTPASVTTNFGWTPPSGATYSTAYLDYSVWDNNFALGTFQSAQILPTQNGLQKTGFAPGVKYYWRINALISGTSNSWVTSKTATFDTPTCTAAPTVTCQMVDYDKSGAVNLADVGIIYTKLEPNPYNPIYDLNKDNVVNGKDVDIVFTFVGRTCTVRDYATINPTTGATATCATLGPGDVVKVDFKWSPAVGNTYQKQYLDYDKTSHSDTGWPASLARQVAVGQGALTLEGFAPDTTYFWRINTQASSGFWNGSAVRSFKTPTACQFTPAPPSNLTATVAVTTRKADGTLCTDSPYGVSFNWTSSAPGWFLDVSPNSFNFSSFSKIDISSKTSLLTTGSDFVPPLTFEPGKSYYWRIYYGVTGRWAVPVVQPFKVDYCNPPPLNELPSGWPTDHGVVSQGPRGGSSHGSLDAIDITGPTGTPIRATLDGVVFATCVSGGSCAYGNLGNAVVLKNPTNNNLIIYAHLQSNSVSPGQNVRKGDVVGGMGCTGYCEGTHLHYEFRGIPMSTPYIPTNVATGCAPESSCGVSW